jgi:hypothetical protein
MGPHDEFLELCAVSTSGNLTEEERKKLNEHLAVCPTCREAFRQFQATVETAIPALAPEFAESSPSADLSWSVEGAEAALFKRLDEQESRPPGSFIDTNGDSAGAYLRRYEPSRIRWSQASLPLAAGILLSLALGIASYRIGLRRGVDVARVPPPASQNSVASIQQEVSDRGHDRQQLLASMEQRDKLIAQLKRELQQQSGEVNSLRERKGQLEAAAVGTQQAKDEKERLAQESVIAKAQVQELQKKLDLEEQQRSQDVARADSLEAKIAGLTRSLSDRDGLIDQQNGQIAQRDELLAHDRDIRELMGARDLYIAEVHDVAKNGQTNKAYGRVFYTKGKSLIFYAYDLDQQTGIRKASTFQVWGRHGADQEQALNLGVFYQDNLSKKRWVMKSNDPKVLAQIDAVFVTVEPNGGSHQPSGKPLLFAYLRINPNHP